VRKTLYLLLLLTALAAPPRGVCAPPPAASWQEAVSPTAHTAPQARIVVLDAESGRILAGRNLPQAARTLAAPGSTLKPLALYSAVESGQWDPARRIACNRRLAVGGHSLACTHPAASPFNASQALTWSCNSYFASLALALRPADLGRILARTGLLGETRLLQDKSTPEARAEFREPVGPEQQQLALLGVEGIRVTPLELAAAYRWLAQEISANPDSSAAKTVASGLADSASFGMAGQAGLGGVSVAGKTGTAPEPSSGRTHGWFAGWAPAKKPQVIVVVFVPGGNGAAAAHIAGELLRHAPLEKP